MRATGRQPASHQARTAVVLMLCPLVAAAQESDPRVGGKLWRFSTSERSGTQVLPDAGQVWRKDGIREAGKERSYWMDYRRQLKARLLGTERANAARIINAARARAEAFGKFETPKRSDLPLGEAANGDGSGVMLPQPKGWPPAGDAISRAAETAKKQLDTASTVARNTTESLARTIERNLPAAKNSTTRTASVIIALLTIFLAPAVLLTTLVFGAVRLRRRRR